MARSGRARQVWIVAVRCDQARFGSSRQVGQGGAMSGLDRLGKAGWARNGSARQGGVRSGRYVMVR